MNPGTDQPIPLIPVSPPWCRHRTSYPENMVMPSAVALQHFDLCLTQEQRLAAFTSLRDQADVARRCWLQDHDGYPQRVASLLAQLRCFEARDRFQRRHGPAYRRRQLARRRRRR